MMVCRRRPSMATWFECRLVGDDPDHLLAVAETVLDEIDRLGRLLSRHDPGGEVARINREAFERPVRVDVEMFSILDDALHRRGETDGYFDVVSPRGSPADSVRLDASARTVLFSGPELSIDLGGYGKGYALDASARILRAFHVESALLHGGTSSVLAFGRPENGDSAWVIGLVDPADGSTEVGRVELGGGMGLSTSGVFDPGSDSTDLIDPVGHRRPKTPASCSVMAPTATDAEVLSTALLVMGKARAARYLRTRVDRLPHPCRVAWIDRSGVDWLEIGGRP